MTGKLSCRLNPILNDKILDMTELRAFADDNLNVVKIMIYPCN